MKIMENAKRKMENGKNLLPPSFVLYFSLFIVFIVGLSGCAQKMASQPDHKPFAESEFFKNGQLAQKPIEGTVPSGWTKTNSRIAPEENFDKNSNELPFPISEEILQRGRERFEINCAICHGFTGEGNGRVAQRGLHPPPNFHDERLRNAPLGHFYDVMSNGFGAMGSYSAQVEPQDRWAIAAYIRALQLSQNASLEDVPADKIGELEKNK